MENTKRGFGDNEQAITQDITIQQVNDELLQNNLSTNEDFMQKFKAIAIETPTQKGLQEMTEKLQEIIDSKKLNNGSYEQSGYVYIICETISNDKTIEENTIQYKIGWTANPQRRIRELCHNNEKQYWFKKIYKSKFAQNLEAVVQCYFKEFNVLKDQCEDGYTEWYNSTVASLDEIIILSQGMLEKHI